MITTKHFAESEFICDGVPCYDKMDKQLLVMLDMARDVAGIPFVISSSWRSIEHNAKPEVGGKPNSAHLEGKAVDIKCSNSRNRKIIVDSLLYAGFERIGISHNFIHADVSTTLPEDVIWLY